MARVRPRVLIVDENAENRDALRTYFESKRYEILTADTSSGLLDTVRRRRPHVVLVDLSMVGDRAIIAAISATAPVIVTTTEAERESARPALEAGAFDVATTPYDLRRVRQLIDAAVEHAPDLL
jgi:DNA-binding NtrC family response regulator